MMAAIIGMKEAFTKLQQECDELREALKPFAEGEEAKGELGDAIWWGNITLADVARAKELLADQPQEGE